ncbi:hypothetical protein HK098_003640 [Nowakowskiella sp. JEL0407]|nr:hypothetical protein HK098_003640 [Nowakowskiella sp. JEL0407]
MRLSFILLILLSSLVFIHAASIPHKSDAEGFQSGNSDQKDTDGNANENQGDVNTNGSAEPSSQSEKAMESENDIKPLTPENSDQPEKPEIGKDQKEEKVDISELIVVSEEPPAQEGNPDKPNKPESESTETENKNTGSNIGGSNNVTSANEAGNKESQVESDKKPPTEFVEGLNSNFDVLKEDMQNLENVSDKTDGKVGESQDNKEIQGSTNKKVGESQDNNEILGSTVSKVGESQDNKEMQESTDKKSENSADILPETPETKVDGNELPSKEDGSDNSEQKQNEPIPVAGGKTADVLEAPVANKDSKEEGDKFPEISPVNNDSEKNGDKNESDEELGEDLEDSEDDADDESEYFYYNQVKKYIPTPNWAESTFGSLWPIIATTFCVFSLLAVMVLWQRLRSYRHHKGYKRMKPFFE